MDSSEALQIGIVAALRSDNTVKSFVGNRIFDAVPNEKDAVFPYVTIGGADVSEDGADCIAGSEMVIGIGIWSRAKGSVEAKRIGRAIANALHQADLDLGPSDALVDLSWTGTAYDRDPDGLTTHGRMLFHALTEAH